jgi:hypothetical protein
MRDSWLPSGSVTNALVTQPLSVGGIRTSPPSSATRVMVASRSGMVTENDTGVRQVGPLTVVVGEVVPSGTLLSGMVVLSVPETVPTPGLLAVTGATDPASDVTARGSAAAEALAIATGTPTAHTPMSAATRVIRDALHMMQPSRIRIYREASTRGEKDRRRVNLLARHGVIVLGVTGAPALVPTVTVRSGW